MRISHMELLEAGLIVTLAFTPCAKAQQIATGQAAFADWNQQQPGADHMITVADLPEPNPQEAVNNTPQLVPRRKDAWPFAPAGFRVAALRDRDDGKTVVVGQGQAVGESVDIVHSGESGDEPTVLLITYAGTPGVPTSIPAKAEQVEY